MVVDLTANERYVDGSFDRNRCRLLFKVDGQERLAREFSRQDGKPFRYEIAQDLKAGEHELAFELQPLTQGEKQVRSLAIRIQTVTMRGPADERYQVQPKNYATLFPEGRAVQLGRSPSICPRAARWLRH